MGKKLNIGLMGCGFMGRAHSNAWRKVWNFFDVPFTPVLKAVCARREAEAQVLPTGGAMSRLRLTGAGWSSAPISTRSTSVRRMTFTTTSR